MKTESCITIIGGGLAGVEAAWSAAQAGVSVRLYEMRPSKETPVHRTGMLGELVCSNSLKSNQTTNAAGLLKEEMRILGSVTMECAEKHRVPAGEALAVDRERFAECVTERVTGLPNVTVIREEVTEIPKDGITIIATGPLTSDALAKHIGELTGSDYLYFYDAVAPTITADSIDYTIVFKASRYGKGEAAYLNCPFNEEQYNAFYDALVSAERMPLAKFEAVCQQNEDRPIGDARSAHWPCARPLPEQNSGLSSEETRTTTESSHPEKLKFFEGCLPIEELAARGRQTLTFGPMKPVGLDDPRTGRWPFAALQLRQENAEGTLFGLVGFQTEAPLGRAATRIPDDSRARTRRVRPFRSNAQEYIHRVA